MAIAKFFLLTFALSWLFFVPAAMTGHPALFLPGVFAPAIVGLILTARSHGVAGVQELLGRMFQWRTGWRWYGFALGYILAIKLTAAGIHRLITGAWPRFGTEPWFVMIIAIALSTPVQSGEELGWRGYALPRLAERFGYPLASLILGVIWAVWHLPQFFLPGADTLGQSFPLFVLQVTAMSVALAWLYLRTNGSVLLTMLMHAAVNNTKDVVPSQVIGATNTFGFSTSLVAWLTVALLWICAGYFLIRMRHASRVRAIMVTSSPAGVSPM